MADAKQRYADGHRRSFRPWIAEPGLWLQFDWGEGPRVVGRKTCLFCAWLAWSRFRVVIPTWDRTMPTLLSCLDAVLRRIGGVPTYLLADNERTVTTEHVAGIPPSGHGRVRFALRLPGLVSALRPAVQGGRGGDGEDRQGRPLPTEANFRQDYGSFAEVAAACDEFVDRVNARPHRETGRPPVQMLAEERVRLHRLPEEPFTAALGDTRLVREDQTIRFGSVRCSTPPGHVGREVWCRVEGDELVVVGHSEQGLREIARHELSTPGRPRIADEHYPNHPPGNERREPRLRPRSGDERAFLHIGPGAERWLREAAATGTSGIRRKMADAVALNALLDAGEVDHALGVAAMAHRFADGDLHSIIEHIQRSGAPGDCVIHDDTFSAQPGTNTWSEFGR